MAFMLVLKTVWVARMIIPYDLATMHDFVLLVKVMSLVNALAVVKFFNIRVSLAKVPTTR